MFTNACRFLNRLLLSRKMTIGTPAQKQTAEGVKQPQKNQFPMTYPPQDGAANHSIEYLRRLTFNNQSQVKYYILVNHEFLLHIWFALKKLLYSNCKEVILIPIFWTLNFEHIIFDFYKNSSPIYPFFGLKIFTTPTFKNPLKKLTSYSVEVGFKWVFERAHFSNIGIQWGIRFCIHFCGPNYSSRRL